MLFKICTIIALAAMFTDCMSEESIAESAKEKFETFGNSAGKAVGDAFESVKKGVSHVGDVVSEGVHDAKENIKDAGERVKDKAEDVVDDGESLFEKAAKSIKNFGQSIGEKIEQTAEMIGEKMGITKSKSESIDMNLKEMVSGIDDDSAVERMQRSRFARQSINE